MMKKYFVLTLFCVVFNLKCTLAQSSKDVDYQNIMTLNGHESAIHNLRFSPDGNFLASCGFDNHVILWDVKTGEMLYKWSGHTDWVTEVTFSKDGQLVASAGQDGICHVWNVKTGDLVATFKSIPLNVNNKIMVALAFVTFSNDSRYVYFGGANAMLMRADLKEPDKPVQKITLLHNNGKFYTNITGGEIMADGKTLVVSIGNFVVALNGETGVMYKKFFYPLQGINDVIVAPDNQKIVAWTFDGHVVIWDYHTMQMLKNLTVTSPKNYSAATLNATNELLATGASGTIAKVWDWQNAEILATLEGHTKIIRTVRFNPMKNMLATASYDGTVKIWQPKNAIQDEINISENDLKVGNTINLKHIQFERGKSLFLKESYPALQKLFDVMEKHSNMVIRLGGHTDNVGKSHLNLRLSGERVRAVKSYLQNKGVSDKRILTHAYGDTRPLTNNNTEHARRLNRRVEITILKL